MTEIAQVIVSVPVPAFARALQSFANAFPSDSSLHSGIYASHHAHIRTHAGALTTAIDRYSSSHISFFVCVDSVEPVLGSFMPGASI